MHKVWCKDEGKDSTTYTDVTKALKACNDSDTCTSVVSNKCSESQKFELCNGFEYERKGGNYECNIGGRKRCELLQRVIYAL